MINRTILIAILFGAFGGLAIFYGCCLIVQGFEAWDLSPTEKVIQQKLAKEGESFNTLTFDLVDPAASPESIRKAVLKGYNIIVNTQQEVKGYVGNRLNCTNCHFAGGITTGGRGGSISLAGVAAKYPVYNKRSEGMIDLAERINMCFERSLNGKSLPLDSDEMLALITYLHWISRNFPTYAKVPWLGLKQIKSTHTGDPEKGKSIYAIKCALCHKSDGHGEGAIPPLWGPESFNDGAGMSVDKVMANFVYWNMPYMNADLTEEEAIDVVSYIAKKPRPSFDPKN